MENIKLKSINLKKISLERLKIRLEMTDQLSKLKRGLTRKQPQNVLNKRENTD